MPCSAAIFRTSGEDLVRMRSSNESPFPAVGGRTAGGDDAMVAAAEGCWGAEETAVDSLFGGGPPAVGAALDAAAGAGAAAAGAANDAASVSMRATTVWTGTVWPSVTRISASTPALGDGISASTLSVEISK